MDELKIDWLIVTQCPVMSDPNVRHYYGSGKLFKHVICSDEAESTLVSLLTTVMNATETELCQVIRTRVDNPISNAYERLVSDYTFEPLIRAFTFPLPSIVMIILAERSIRIVRGINPIFERESIEETPRDYFKLIKETCDVWEDGTYQDELIETFRLKYPHLL